MWRPVAYHAAMGLVPVQLPRYPQSDIVVPVEDTDGLYRAVSRESAAGRAALLLALGHHQLRTGESRDAWRHFDDGLALTRSHRTARPLRSRLLTGASMAARAQGHFRMSVSLAETATRIRNQTPEAAASAWLAVASAHRLAGAAWESLTATHTALGLYPTPEGQVAKILTWMTLMPGQVLQEARELVTQVDGELQARLAWHLAEYALGTGDQQAATGWLLLTRDTPSAAEEGRVCLLAARQSALSLPPVSDVREPVDVLTLNRRGLQVGDRFIPVPGSGHQLALLAFLIRDGATPWLRAAEAVLAQETSTEAALYTQVRSHLTTIRRLVGDPGCVSSRRGILDLASDRVWQCDVEKALVSGRGAPAWLPNVTGWWAVEIRSQLRNLPQS